MSSFKLKQIHLDESVPHPERTLELRQQDGRCSLQGEGLQLEARVVLTSPSEGWMHEDGQVTPFRVARSKDGVEVWLAGQVYRFATVQPQQARRGGARTSGDLTAPMPGTVLRVAVAAGEAVAAKAPLVIMESMKMELTLAAPFAGVIEDVPAVAGSMVEMGALLVRMRATEPQDG